MTARLLTNIGRLWTGSEILSNAAIVTSDDRIAWVGPSAELPRSVPGVVDDIVDVDLVENLGGGLAPCCNADPGQITAETPALLSAATSSSVAVFSRSAEAHPISAATRAAPVRV